MRFGMVWIPWFDTAAGVGVLRKSTNSPLYSNNNTLYINTQISNLYSGFQIIIKPFLLVLDSFPQVFTQVLRLCGYKVWEVWRFWRFGIGRFGTPGHYERPDIDALLHKPFNQISQTNSIFYFSKIFVDKMWIKLWITNLIFGGI